MSTSARSSVALLVAVLLCGLGILAVVWIARGRTADGRGAPGRTGDAHDRASLAPLGYARLDDSAGGPSRSSGAGTPAASERSKNRFDGRGVIRGQVVAKGGLALPECWVLSIEPSPWLEGREHAAFRRIEFEHGEKEFRVEDLPLAGYLVRAQASGLNNIPANVLLVKGSEDQYITTALLPSGFIDGSVLDHLGRPAEGLDVTLESATTRERRTVSTDVAGGFLFRDVIDGEYRLCLGRPDSPLLPADSLAFKAPSMRFPNRTLPPTGRMRILACDPQSRLLPRAAIKGYGSPGGAIDAIADEKGKADVRYLPPGRYRIEAKGEDGGEGDVTVELAAGQELDVAVVVRR